MLAAEVRLGQAGDVIAIFCVNIIVGESTVFTCSRSTSLQACITQGPRLPFSVEGDSDFDWKPQRRTRWWVGGDIQGQVEVLWLTNSGLYPKFYTVEGTNDVLDLLSCLSHVDV